MPDLPAQRTETTFEDFKTPYGPGQAAIEANRCLYCQDAPCITACPTAIDIPEFIRKIATGNVRGSARTIFEANVLGMSCARVCPVEVLCVGDCVYNAMDVPPIEIGKLQRFATDMAYEQGWRFFEQGPATGRSVGLVGAGPAPLACAHALSRLGHTSTIYEKRPVLGGLNTSGVAPYKMRADRALEEVDWVLSIGGIEVRTGVTVPDDMGWRELEDRHDALFIAFGLGADRLLTLPGSDLDGVKGAVEHIEALKCGTVDLGGVRRAAVVGGGNTAVDSVRELLGLGVQDVTMIYRGNEEAMSGYRHEWAAARKEGAQAVWRRQPVGFEGQNGRVRGVRCVELDDDRRPRNDTEHLVPADIVLVAIGQRRLSDLVSGLEGVEIQNGHIMVDEKGATGRSGVFSGGDCANGGKEVVNAVGEGRAAAFAIDEYLRTGSQNA